VILKRILCLVFFSAGFLQLRAQEISIVPVYTRDSVNTIYALKLLNSSEDSIVVLHAQVFVEPPFINHYAQQVEVVKGEKIFSVHIGRSNNPRMPERYTAIRAVTPGGVQEMYFDVASPDSCLRLAEIYFTLLDKKYLSDFQRMDQLPSEKDVQRCKKLKEKYGKVKRYSVEF
jgi:hypothetical protein